MSEMIERVAKAIYEKRNGAGCVWWVRLPNSHKDPYRADARAAIGAMKEPTDAMMQALHEAMFVDKYDATDQPMLGAGIEAFIDAALNEEG
jgi:hypothetical protein